MLSVDVATWYLYITSDNEEGYIQAFQRLMDFRYDMDAAVRRLGLEGQSFSGKTEAERNVLRQHSAFMNYKLHKATPLIKDPFALVSLPWFVRRFNARPVVMIRHPAAFVASLKRQGWGFRLKNILDQPFLMRDHPVMPSPMFSSVDEVDALDNRDVRKIAFGWRYLYGVVACYRDTYPEWHFIRHEDLSSDPLGGFARLFQALDLAWSASIEMHIKAETMSHEADVHGRGHKRFTQGWRQHLNKEDIASIRAVTEDVASLYYCDEDW
jgi:hypothetical protein